MNEFMPDDEMFAIKKKLQKLKLSKTLSHSLFGMMKLIENKSEEMTIQGSKVKAMSVSTLYETVHISRPALSKTLKECEHKGYLVKYVSDTDKRYMLVALTSKGEQALFQAKQEIMASVKWIASHFTKEEYDMYHGLIVKLNHVLDEFNRKDE